ncbi:MAG: hypothetical protein GQ574_11100 [Crocinitomix sp.]|nr:hypothetical protein [Crocinitomix sp.]
MKYLFLFLICSSAFLTNAQDTLYLKSGEHRPVKIIEIDSTLNIVGYVYQSDTLYAAINSFEKIIYKRKVNSAGSLISTAIINDSEKSKEAVLSKIKPNPKYLYGKWAISTNLTSYLGDGNTGRYSINPVFSIEPEYFIVDRLSLKMPISFGFPTKDLTSYSIAHGFKYHNSPDKLPYVSYFQNRRNQMGHARDLLFQIGLNPKYYFKGQRTFAWYLGQGFYASYVNLNRVDYYYTFKKTYQDGDYYWRVFGSTFEAFKENSIVFRYEGAIGLAINVIKNVGLTTELGYSTVIRKENSGIDQVFVQDQGGDFQLDPLQEQYTPYYRSGLLIIPYFRLHAVYRFGGVKNVMK